MIAWSDLEFAISWPLPPTIMSTNVTSAPPVSGLGEELFRVEGRVE